MSASMTVVLAAGGGAYARALWYLTRGSGLVALVLLTLVVVLGVGASTRWARLGWPRFLTADLHRNVSLLTVVFVGIHVYTSVLDSFAPISWLDAIVPFVGRYRPLWLGFGTLAFDLMLALIGTSLLRLRLGHRAWRAVHWLAYACWPVAVLHGLGTGSDTQVGWAELLTWACVLAVVIAVGRRIAGGWPAAAALRTSAAVVAVAVPLGLGIFTAAGPLQRGWARRAGTPPALLAAAANRPAAGTGTTAAPSTPGGTVARLPYSGSFSGTVGQRAWENNGIVVSIAGTVHGSAERSLRIDLYGQPLDNGGVALARGDVRLSGTGAPTYRGEVTQLAGTQLVASMRDEAGQAATLRVTLSLQGADATGQVRLSSASGSG